MARSITPPKCHTRAGNRIRDVHAVIEQNLHQFDTATFRCKMQRRICVRSRHPIMNDAWIVSSNLDRFLPLFEENGC